MAKRVKEEKTRVEKDELDDFNFDFEDPDIGIPGEKGDRQPVRALSIGFADGVKSDLGDKTKAFNRLKGFLPESYSTTLDVADTTLGTVSDLYQTLKHETRDGVRSLKRVTNELVQPHKDKLPKWLGKRLDAVLKTDDDARRLETDDDALRDQAIESTLSSIFKLQLEQAEKTKEEQTTEGIIKETIDEKRHLTVSDHLLAIRQGVDRQVSYQNQITSKVYSKQLELQFKTYHTLEKQLSVQEKFARDAKEALQATAKNTALPDYRKLQLTESVGHSLREKFANSAQEKITGLATGFFERFGGRLKEQVGAYAKTLNQQLKEVSGLASEFQGTGDSINPMQLAGMLLGGEVSDQALQYAAPRVRRFLEQQGIVSDAGDDLQQFTDDLPRLLNQFAQNNMGGLGPKAWLADLIGDNRISSTVAYQKVEDSDKPALFDYLTRQSIVEIIPGYLSRIHLELKRFREGLGVEAPDDSGRLGFNLKTRDFETQEAIQQRLDQEIFSGVKQPELNERLDGIIEQLDLRDHVDSRDQQRVEEGLKALLIGLHYQGKPLSLEHLVDTGISSQFMDEDASELLNQAVRQRYQGEDTYSESGEHSFQYDRSRDHQARLNRAKYAFNRIHENMTDPKGVIEGYLSLGYEQPLRELGVIKTKADGTPLIDYPALFKRIGSGDLPSLDQSSGFEDSVFTPEEKLSGETLEKAKEEQRKQRVRQGLNWLRRRQGKPPLPTESDAETPPPADESTETPPTQPAEETASPLVGPLRQQETPPTQSTEDTPTPSTDPSPTPPQSLTQHLWERLPTSTREWVTTQLKHPSDPQSPETHPDTTPPTSRWMDQFQRWTQDQSRWGISAVEQTPLQPPMATTPAQPENGLAQVKQRLAALGQNALGHTLSTVAKGSDAYRYIWQGESPEDTTPNAENQTLNDRLERSKTVAQRTVDALQPEKDSVADHYKEWIQGLTADAAQSIQNQVEKHSDASRDDSLKTIAGNYHAWLGDLTRETSASLRDRFTQLTSKPDTPIDQPSPVDSVVSMTGGDSPVQTLTATIQGFIDQIQQHPTTPGVQSTAPASIPTLEPTQSPTGESVLTHLAAIRRLLNKEDDGFPTDIQAIREHLLNAHEISSNDAHTAVLSRILETVEGIGQHLAQGNEASEHLLTRIGKKSAQVLSSMTSAVGSYYLGALRLFGGGLGGLGQIALGSGRALGQGIGRLFSTRDTTPITDVYLKGHPDTPVLTAKGFNERIYFDNVTGRTIASVDDLSSLKGDILDQDGNLVVKKSDLSKGIVDASGAQLGGVSLLKRLGQGVGLVKNAAFTPYRVVGKIVASAIGAGTSFINRVRDVYVKGETTPRLLARVMKNGGYISATTGRPLYKLSDIDGEIHDRQGNVVLSLEDMRLGLVDWKGEPLDFLDRQLKRVLKATTGAFKVAGWGARQVGRYYRAVGRGVGSLVKGGVNVLRGRPMRGDRSAPEQASLEGGDDVSLLGDELLTSGLSPFAQSKVELTTQGPFADRLFDLLERIAGCSCGDKLAEAADQPLALGWDGHSPLLGSDEPTETREQSTTGSTRKKIRQQRDEWNDDSDDYRDNSWREWLHGDRASEDDSSSTPSPSPDSPARRRGSSGSFLRNIASVGGAVLGFAGRKTMDFAQRRRRRRQGDEDEAPASDPSDLIQRDETQDDDDRSTERDDSPRRERLTDSRRERDDQRDEDAETDEDDSGEDRSSSRAKRSKRPYADEWSDDGDEYRDNSWREWLYGQKEQKEDGASDQRVEQAREEKEGSWLSTLLAMAGPILAFIKTAAVAAFAGIKKLLGSAKAVFETLRNKLGGFFKEAGKKLLDWGKRGAKGAWELGKKGAKGLWELGKKGAKGAWELGKKGLKAGGRAIGHAARIGGRLAGRAATTGLRMGARAAVVGLAKAGAVVAGTLSAPVLITGAAIVAVGVAGYFAWKYFKGKKQSPLTQHRLLQYGIDPDNEDDNAKVLMLEKEMKGKLTLEQGTIIVDDSVEFEKIAQSFGVDPDDPDSVDAFIVWLNGRFLPVYWAATQALHAIDASRSLNTLDELSTQEQWTYFQKAKNPKPLDEDWAHPYVVMDSPFGGGELTVTPAQIQRSEEDLLALLEKERAKAPDDDDTVGSTTRRQRREKKDDNTDEEQSNRVRPKTRGQRERLTEHAYSKAKRSLNRSSGTELGKRIGSEITKAVSPIEAMTLARRAEQYACQPVEAVLYHVAGVVKLTKAQVELFQALTDRVLNDCTYDNEGLAHWEGDVDALFQQFNASFATTWDDTLKERWSQWFHQRFLPTYLAYLTQIRQHFLDPEVAVANMRTNLAIQHHAASILATLMVKHDDEYVAIWQVGQSPWESLALNRDPESVRPYLEYLKTAIERAQRGGDERLVEGMSTVAGKTPPPPPTEPTKPRGAQGRRQRRQNAQQPPTPQAGGAQGAVGLASEETVTALNQRYYQEASQSSVNAPPISGAGGGVGVTHPGGGTGGDVNDLPLSKGDGSWDAHKDVIVAASQMAGVDPGIMATMAAIESGFRARVKAKTSSAQGLYQFINSTWKEMLKKYGSKYGLSANASRNDPRANALMGAEFLKENARALEGVVKGPITDTHLYAAHFLGAGGARKLFRSPGQTNAVRLMPDPAQANRSIFFSGHRQRSVDEVYAELNRRVSTRREKYADAARRHAAQFGTQSKTADLDEGDAFESFELGELNTVAPQHSPMMDAATVHHSPVLQPTQTVSDRVQASTPTMAVQDSPTLPGAVPGATNQNMQPSQPSANVAGALEVLKKRVAGGHVDVNNVNQTLAGRLAAFIQDIEAQTGRKTSIQSAYRPPTDREKKATRSPGTTQASISSSPLAASVYGSMHGRGEAIDIRYSDMRSIKEMNRMPARDKQVWFQTAKKHGLALPLLAGEMGPGTGRKGSTYKEWWHVEPNNPYGGRRGDIKLRGQQHAEHILSNAISQASTQTQPDASTAPTEEATPKALQAVEGDATQQVAGDATQAPQTPTPSTPATPPSPATPALPHPNAQGVAQSPIEPAALASPIQTVKGLIQTGRGLPRTLAQRITAPIESLSSALTPRQQLASAVGIDSSTGIDQALNRHPEVLERQRAQQAQLVNTRVIEQQERQFKDTETLGSIHEVLQTSLTTQRSMDSNLTELVKLARLQAAKPTEPSTPPQQDDFRRVTSEPQQQRRQGRRQYGEKQPGVVHFNRQIS